MVPLQWVTALTFFQDFFKAAKNSNMLDGSVNLITLENWFDKKIKITL